MKTKIYAVYDSKAEAYMQPFFMQSRGIAMRSWEDIANDEKSQICKTPGDFTLFELGEWDEQTGVITMHESQVNLGLAIHVKRPEAKLHGLRSANLPTSNEVQQLQ